MKIHRGDVVVCAVQGDYGKPRPAIVVQSDLFNETHASLTLCPLTSDLIDTPLFRVMIEPSLTNGLEKQSQIMVDKIVSVHRERIRQKIGKISARDLDLVIQALHGWLGP